MANSDRSRRILLVDDNPGIHRDYQKILCETDVANLQFASDDELIFGETESESTDPLPFITESALQGKDALELVEKSLEEGRPFSVAVVDVRMPPGLDGVQTAKRIWQIDPNIMIIFCTAFSDYSWKEMTSSLNRSDQFVILKKPFDGLELTQLVLALSQKWELHRQIDLKDLATDAVSDSGDPACLSRKSMKQFVHRLKLACAGIIYRQSRVEWHQQEEGRGLDSDQAPCGLGEASSKIQSVCDEFVAVISSNSVSNDSQFRESHRRMLQIIDNLLVLSELDDHRFEPSESSFSLVNLIEPIEQRFREVFNQVDFKIEIAPEIPNFISMHATSLRLLINNLLEHALDHVSEGQVNLKLSVGSGTQHQRAATDGSPDFLSLELSCSSLDGIETGQDPTEKRPSKLAAFEQIRNPTVGGEIQLGLLACSRVVDALKGVIEVESRVGETQLSIGLPLRKQPCGPPHLGNTESLQSVELFTF